MDYASFEIDKTYEAIKSLGPKTTSAQMTLLVIVVIWTFDGSYTKCFNSNIKY